MELCRDVSLPYFCISNITRFFFLLLFAHMIMEEHTLVMLSLDNHIISKAKTCFIKEREYLFLKGNGARVTRMEINMR